MQTIIIYIQNIYVFTSLLYGLLMPFVEHHIKINVIEHKKN